MSLILFYANRTIIIPRTLDVLQMQFTSILWMKIYLKLKGIMTFSLLTFWGFLWLVSFFQFKHCLSRGLYQRLLDILNAPMTSVLTGFNYDKLTMPFIGLTVAHPSHKFVAILPTINYKNSVYKYINIIF